MAETLTADTLVGYTCVIDDGTRSYTVLLTEGQLDITIAGHEVIWTRNTDGTIYGPPRQGQQTGPSTIAFTSVIFGTGDDATDIALIDFLARSGLYVSTWVGESTVDDAAATGSGLKDFTVTISRSDLTSATAANASAGASWVFEVCVFQGGGTISMARDGNKISATIQSANAYPTITQNP